MTDWDRQMERVANTVLKARLHAYQDLLEELEEFDYITPSQIIGAIHTNIDAVNAAIKGNDND